MMLSSINIKIVMTFIILLNFFLFIYLYYYRTQFSSVFSKCECDYNVDEWIKHFYKIAEQSGSDKVSTHHYESMYGQFLYPIRNNQINLLEIGLGCDMNYGPGKSLNLWKRFLPNASINILEYDKNCALKFSSKVNNMFTGDQADFNVLNQVSEKGPYDVIIDDGGHSRKQQINSLIGLWPYVKSKGFYIIEDIFTSFLKEYNDNPSESSIDVIFQLISLLNEAKDLKSKTMLPKNIPISKFSRDIAQDLLFISCYQRVCLLAKK